MGAVSNCNMHGLCFNNLKQGSYQLDAESQKVGQSLSCQAVRCSQCSSLLGHIVIKDNSMGKVNIEFVQRFMIFHWTVESNEIGNV